MNVLEKNLSVFSNEEIVGGLKYLTATERKITYHILRFILEIEVRDIHLAAGFDSLCRYLQNRFNYSERSAIRRINAARMLKSSPQVSEKIQSGEIKLSQLERLQQTRRQHAQEGNAGNTSFTAQVLERLENKTAFETKKILAVEFNVAPKTSQRIHPQSDGSVRIEFTFSEAQFAAFKKAQASITHVVWENDLAAVISHLASLQNKKVEGKQPSATSDRNTKSTLSLGRSEHSRAERDENECGPSATSTQSTGVSQSTHHSMRTTASKYIRRNVRRSLSQKSNRGCTFVGDDGHICGSSYQYQVGHEIPLAAGGNDEPENFRGLCSAHNRYEARRWGLGNDGKHRSDK